MPRQLKTIEMHLNACNEWIEEHTGSPLTKTELEMWFKERIALLKRRHLDARFESYDIPDCLNAMEIVNPSKKSTKL